MTDTTTPEHQGGALLRAAFEAHMDSDGHPYWRTTEYGRDAWRIWSAAAALGSVCAGMQASKISMLEAKIERLRTVMIAAAEEIGEHWEAHCDAEGYGPANLMHRLEQGIPSEYGYTAGAFAELRQENARLMIGSAESKQEIERLRKDAERYQKLRAALGLGPGRIHMMTPRITAPFEPGKTYTPDGLDAALDALPVPDIDAAMAAKG